MITESRFLDLRSCQNSGPAVCVIFLEGPIYLELTVKLFKKKSYAFGVRSIFRGPSRIAYHSSARRCDLKAGFQTLQKTQNIFQTIYVVPLGRARSECKLRDPCSDGSEAKDERSMPML